MRDVRDEVMLSVLDLAREAVGMDEAHLGTFIPGFQVIQETCGDSEHFGVCPGARIPAGETFCHRMLDGRIPQVIPDVSLEPRVASLQAVATGMVGAYVGIPIISSDGTVLGTLCCVSAQPDPDLKDRDIDFLRILGQLLGDRIRRQELEENENQELEALIEGDGRQRLPDSSERAWQLAHPFDYRDEHTFGHSERVAALSESIARAFGADESFCELIRLAAPLHDLGARSLPEGVAVDVAGLSLMERAVLEAHSEIEYSLMSEDDGDLLGMAARIARTHHERFDGGERHGLSEDAIPIEGRIVAIADVYDALTMARGAGRAMTQEQAVKEMMGDVGRFDPELLDIFVEMVLPALPEDGDLPGQAG